MKLCRVGEFGRERPAVVAADGSLRDLSGHIDDISAASIGAGALDGLAAIDIESLPRINRPRRYGVPVAGIGKIVCAGMNYRDHCEEAGFPIPEQPALFMKATTSLSGANDDIRLPGAAQQVDWEIELAVVIGRRAAYVSPAEALRHVAGYAILNDVSDRDFQFNHGGQWFKGKSADTFCPLGPWLVTPDEVPDPQALELFLDLNGQRRQTGTTAKMIFSVAELISHTSQYMTLLPGDVLSTGTPPGVGMGQKPQVYLKQGDRLRLGITGLGEQQSQVIAALAMESVA
jgi:2,4-diketo-3-deoxy-L-fuconate hydrolase